MGWSLPTRSLLPPRPLNRLLGPSVMLIQLATTRVTIKTRKWVIWSRMFGLSWSLPVRSLLPPRQLNKRLERVRNPIPPWSQNLTHLGPLQKFPLNSPQSTTTKFKQLGAAHPAGLTVHEELTTKHFKQLRAAHLATLVVHEEGERGGAERSSYG